MGSSCAELNWITQASMLDRKCQLNWYDGAMAEVKTGTTASCPIARCLAVVGEKWALLIVRDAMAGVTRFAQFRSSLGIAPDILAGRLGKLVDHGILERRSYRSPGERAREEYLLTPVGRDLAPVLAALGGWGTKHLPVAGGSSWRYLDRGTGQPAHIGFQDAAGRPVPVERVALEWT